MCFYAELLWRDRVAGYTWTIAGPRARRVWIQCPGSVSTLSLATAVPPSFDRLRARLANDPAKIARRMLRQTLARTIRGRCGLMVPKWPGTSIGRFGPRIVAGTVMASGAWRMRAPTAKAEERLFWKLNHWPAQVRFVRSLACTMTFVSFLCQLLSLMAVFWKAPERYMSSH